MPFLDHLEELRWRVFKALGAIFVGTIAGFVLVFRLDAMDLVLRPLRSVVASLSEGRPEVFQVGPIATGDLIFLSPTEPFFFLMKLGLIVGLILSSPLVIWQIWAFLSPALEKEEKRMVIPSLYLGVVLFLTGVTLSYFFALPVTLKFLISFGAEWFAPMLTAGYYFSFVTRLLLVFGIVFELPVVVMILSTLGLVTPRFLREKRRHAIVLITVVASFLSPGDFVAVTIMLMVPLIFLYELSILLAAMVYRKREKQLLGPVGAPEGAVEAEG